MLESYVALSPVLGKIPVYGMIQLDSGVFLIGEELRDIERVIDVPSPVSYVPRKLETTKLSQ